MTLHEVLDQLFFGPVAWTGAGLWLLDRVLRGAQKQEGLFALNFLVQLVIAVALLIISYLLAPKPKAPQPNATKDFEAPTAEAGRPVPVVFGTKTVKGANILWWGDKRILSHKISAK